MRKGIINFTILMNICMILISCNGMYDNEKEYKDSIVVMYFQGLRGVDDMTIDYEYMKSRANGKEPTDTIELSYGQFYALKAKLTSKKIAKERAWDGRVFMKWDTLSVCFNEYEGAINKEGYRVDISQRTLHEILTLSQYYNHFSKEWLECMPTIRKYGIPSDYHYIPYTGLKVGRTSKVFLVPSNIK